MRAKRCRWPRCKELAIPGFGHCRRHFKERNVNPQKKNFIGEILQLGGIIAAAGGVIAGYHHLAISIPVTFGALAFFVGKKLRG